MNSEIQIPIILFKIKQIAFNYAENIHLREFNLSNNWFYGALRRDSLKRIKKTSNNFILD